MQSNLPPEIDSSVPSARQRLREADQRVFTSAEFRSTLSGIVSQETVASQETQVAKTIGLNRTVIVFEKYREVRYHWPEATNQEIAQSLNARAYLSHYSALALHGLLPYEPTEVYLNEEQSPKPQGSGKLRQGSIDSAFKRVPRLSNHVGRSDDLSFIKLNGKHTQNEGVETITLGPATVKVTNLPRTLIDCVVRPFYAGGPKVILSAYEAACQKADPVFLIERIAAMLPKIGHAYPFHQSIGFYFSRACPELDEQLLPLRDLGLNFDFYLDYQMEDPILCRKWRIYYPEDL